MTPHACDAVVLGTDEFAATRRLLTGTLGLTPAMEQSGWSMFAMPNGTVLDLFAPGAVPPRSGISRDSTAASMGSTSRSSPTKSHRWRPPYIVGCTGQLGSRTLMPRVGLARRPEPLSGPKRPTMPLIGSPDMGKYASSSLSAP
jgi:hypothetical protein